MQVVETPNSFLKEEITALLPLKSYISILEQEFQQFSLDSSDFFLTKTPNNTIIKHIKVSLNLLKESINKARIAVVQRSRQLYTEAIHIAQRAINSAKTIKEKIKNFIQSKHAFAKKFYKYELSKKLDSIWRKTTEILNTIIHIGENTISKTKVAFEDTARFIPSKITNTFKLYNSELSPNKKKLQQLSAENSILASEISSLLESSQNPKEKIELSNLRNEHIQTFKRDGIIDQLSKKLDILSESLLKRKGYKGYKGISDIESPSDLYGTTVNTNEKLKITNKKLEKWQEKTKNILGRHRDQLNSGKSLALLPQNNKLFGVDKKAILIMISIATIFIIGPRIVDALKNRARKKIKENQA